MQHGKHGKKRTSMAVWRLVVVTKRAAEPSPARCGDLRSFLAERRVSAESPVSASVLSPEGLRIFTVLSVLSVLSVLLGTFKTHQNSNILTFPRSMQTADPLASALNLESKVVSAAFF